MKTFLINLTGILAATAVVTLATPASAQQKVGTVDLNKVFEHYYKTIQSNVAIRQEAAEMEKEHLNMVDAEKKHEEEWRKTMDKADDPALSADERAKSREAAKAKYADLETEKQSIQEYDRLAVARLQEKKRQKRDDIVKEIQGVLTADARQAGYTMILDVSGESANMAPVVLYNNGQYDLTDALIKELNANAPPGSLETNAAPAASALPGAPLLK